MRCKDAQKLLQEIHTNQKELDDLCHKLRIEESDDEKLLILYAVRMAKGFLDLNIRRLSNILYPYQLDIRILQNKLEQRAQLFSVKAPQLDVPKIHGLTKEHIEALQTIFGRDRLEPFVMPSPDDITDDYFRMMYPTEQHETDRTNGLESSSEQWWDNATKSVYDDTSEETYGQGIVRSLKASASEFEEALILTESIQRPWIKGDHHEQYGSRTGRDRSLDTLLPVIKKLFGPYSNRFFHSWNDINEKLCKKITKIIHLKFQRSHLTIPKFEVILTPALISNLQTTFFHPENSNTSTSEWTSTKVPMQRDSETGRHHYMYVNKGIVGGAGDVNFSDSFSSSSHRGFRISIVFRN